MWTRRLGRKRRGPESGEANSCPPQDWRRGKRLPVATRDTRVESRSSGGCRIKGNISRRGRIYHVPGGHYYGHPRIDTSKGECWFCSEAEARSAGWRRSRR